MLVIGEEKRVGLGRRAPSRFMTLACLVFASLLLVFSQYTAEASVFEKARASIADASAPLLEAFSAPIEATNAAIGRVSDYFSVINENRRLREENAKLRAWRDEALRLRQEISHFDAVNNFAAPPTAVFIDARVIGEANSPYRHAFLINAGRKTEAGVQEGSAVVDDRGLIGHVVNAGDKASRVLLLTDFASNIPVFIEGADEQAILAGRIDKLPVLNFVASATPAAIEPGQRVVTSGKGGALPRGLPVGVVADVSGEVPRVALFSDFDRTRLVRVIRYEFPTSIEGDETETASAAASADGGEDAPEGA